MCLVVWSGELKAENIELAENALGPDIRFHVATNHGEVGPLREDMEILVDNRPSDYLLDAPKLTHVITPWAGVSPVLIQQIRERPHLTLCNSHANAPFVAQHAFALLLACADRTIESHASLDNRYPSKWDQPLARPLLLEGGTCLLVGYGYIGKRIAPLVRAMGMDVITYRRNPQVNGDYPPSYGPSELLTAVQRADAIIVSLPLTAETRGLIDEKILRAMKKHALLVNVGRAEVIDQEALYRGLSTREIQGAALDVWWNYPQDELGKGATYPAEFPFHELSNVILSPHRADQVEALESAYLLDVAATVAAIQGGESRNIVDISRGY